MQIMADKEIVPCSVISFVNFVHKTLKKIFTWREKRVVYCVSQ